MNPQTAVKFEHSQLFQGKEKTTTLAKGKGHNTVKQSSLFKGLEGI